MALDLFDAAWGNAAAAHDTSSRTLWLSIKGIGLPCWAMEREAASRISTTCRPVHPSEMGDAPVRTQLMKCSASVSNASLTERCGAHMSPARYPIRNWWASSSARLTVMPLSYSLIFSVASKSPYTIIFLLPPMNVWRILTGESQLTLTWATQLL